MWVHLISHDFCFERLLCKIRWTLLLYPSPSQTADEFSKFQLNLGKLLNQLKHLKSSFTVLLGDLNVKSNSWWMEDITTNERSQIEY